MARADSDRNLLFGILALQMDFVTRDALVAGMNAWVLAKDRPLGQILQDQGALDPRDRALLEPMVARHIERAGGDASKSLAVLSGASDARDAVAAVDDPDVQASLAAVGARRAVGAADGPVMSAASFSGSGPGSSSGRFRVLRPHARGGLGQVYVARDEELGREVALKEILPEKAASFENRARFVLEAEINGKLEHPGIVPVYGLGSYDDGRPFYAMRYIEGDSLREALERFHGAGAASRTGRDRFQSREFRDLLRRFIDVCDAVAYAHSRGVLHRDLKPANVMLGRYGETLIIDWGLAKATGRQEPVSAGSGPAPVVPTSGSHEPTVAGSALGTPAFMSPEQAEGRLDRLGPATDVYGLGAVLYNVLTGRPPAQGANAEEVLARVRRGDVPPPRSVAADVPRGLEAVCLKALAREPEQRYASARALAEDVEHWLADEPVSARRDPLAVRAWRWVRRHRTLATAAAAALLVGLAALGVAYRREAAHARDLADANQEIGRKNTELTRTVAQLQQANAATQAAQRLADARLDRAMAAIEDYYTGVNDEALRGGKLPPALRDRLLARPQQFYEQLTAELAARPDPSPRERYLQAKGRGVLANLLRMLGRNDEAVAQCESAIQTLGPLAAGRPDDLDVRHALAVAYSDLGVVFQVTGRFDRATAEFRKAIAAFGELRDLRPDEPLYAFGQAQAQRNVGNVLHDTGQSVAALDELRKAIATLGSLSDRHPGQTRFRQVQARSQLSLGVALNATGKPAEAAQVYREAIAHLKTLTAGRPDSLDLEIDLAQGLNNLARIQNESGQSATAAEGFREAIVLMAKVAAREPDVPDHLNQLSAGYQNLGTAMLMANRFADAVEPLQRSIEAREKLVARFPDVPEYLTGLGRARINLGAALARQGRLSEAIEVLRKGIEVLQGLVSLHPDRLDEQALLAGANSNLSETLRQAGRPGEAVGPLRDAVKSLRTLAERYPERLVIHNTLGSAQGNLGRVLAQQGKPEEGIALLRDAVRTRAALLTRVPQAAQVRTSLSNDYTSYAELLRQAGRTDESMAVVRERVRLWPGDSTQILLGACELGLTLAAERDRAKRGPIADAMMATVNQAVSAGWSDPWGLQVQPELAALRGRDDFRRLCDQLMDRAMPDDPFTPPAP
ncbi:MAG: tetratricopeptide repeat protein [Isosphaeraceae bacterium]